MKMILIKTSLRKYKDGIEMLKAYRNHKLKMIKLHRNGLYSKVSFEFGDTYNLRIEFYRKIDE